MALDTATEDQVDVTEQDTEDQQQQAIATQEGRSVKFSGIRVNFTTTAAAIPANLGWTGWLSAWETVGQVRESSKWWQGDLINFAEDKGYGQKYSQVLDSGNYGTLKNIASVAGKFTPEMRRPNLEWSHHSAAAPLIPDHVEAALEILKTAEENNWSVNEVRAAVREYRDRAPTDVAPTPAPTQDVPTDLARGILAIDPSAVADDYGYECLQCPDLVFPEVGMDGAAVSGIAHCLNCGAHFDLNASECPFCPEVAQSTTTPVPVAPEATSAQHEASGDDPDDGSNLETDLQEPVSGQVITPADQSDVSFDDLYDAIGITAMSIEDAVELAGTIPGIVGKLTGLHTWIGRVIEGLTPVSDKPKRGRPSNAEKRAKIQAPTAPVAVSDDSEPVPFE